MSNFLESIKPGKPNSSLAIDVSLLAILLALHVTKKNKNMEMIVLAILLAHVVMTTNPPLSYSNVNIVADEYLGVSPETQAVPEEPVPNVEPEDLHVEKPIEKAGNMYKHIPPIKDSEFRRQFTTPSGLAKIESVLPESSSDANQKIANSRSNFFADILDHK